MSARVFVLEPTELGLDKAGRHGPLRFLFPSARAHPSSLTSEFGASVVRELRTASFQPTRDLLCVTGKLSSMVAMVAAAVAEYGEVRTLCWDARESVRDYQIVTMGEHHYAPESVVTVRESAGHAR
jgi:hypothetical protein